MIAPVKKIINFTGVIISSDQDMQILISPAKTMAGTSKIQAPAGTTPRFASEAIDIALQMTQFPADELARILKLSPKIAAETYRRFQDFHTEEKPPIQAILAYTGIVFKNIHPADFTKADFLYAQNHLRFGSFGYGLLRPLDLIKPYRMEYNVTLPELGNGNMYTYWQPRQTQMLIDDVKAAGSTLVYLASMDIQPAFDWKKVVQSVRVITPEFKVWKNGKPNTIVIYAKMARGQLTRHIIRNRISNPEELKSFTWEGFSYNESLSEKNRWVFMQEG